MLDTLTRDLPRLYTVVKVGLYVCALVLIRFCKRFSLVSKVLSDMHTARWAFHLAVYTRDC